MIRFFDKEIKVLREQIAYLVVQLQIIKKDKPKVVSLKVLNQKWFERTKNVTIALFAVFQSQQYAGVIRFKSYTTGHAKAKTKEQQTMHAHTYEVRKLPVKINA